MEVPSPGQLSVPRVVTFPWCWSDAVWSAHSEDDLIALASAPPGPAGAGSVSATGRRYSEAFRLPGLQRAHTAVDFQSSTDRLQDTAR